MRFSISFALDFAKFQQFFWFTNWHEVNLRKKMQIKPHYAVIFFKNMLQIATKHVVATSKINRILCKKI